MTKFTIGEAWSQGLAFLNAHFQIILILIGGSTLIGALVQIGLFGFNEQLFTQQMQAAAKDGSLQQFFSSVGPGLAGAGIVSAILQSAAQFATFRVGLAKSEEGVGPALSYGIVAAIIYLLFSIVLAVGIILVLAIPFAVLGGAGLFSGAAPSAGTLGVFFILILALIPLVLWIGARLSVVVPAMAEARSTNPLFGLAESWRLTRGNAGGIILYFIVLGVALIVVSAIIGGIGGAIGALIGGAGGQMLSAVLVGVPTAIIGVGITAGIYRTLAPYEPGDIFA